MTASRRRAPGLPLAVAGLAALLLPGCPVPPTERPEPPPWRVEVLRSADGQDRFGDVALHLGDGGAVDVLYNDLDAHAVGLARLRPEGLRIEYPVTQTSWTAVGLGAEVGGRVPIDYVVSPRTIVHALWDGRALEEAERREVSEEELREFRRERASVLEASGAAQAFALDGPDGLRSDGALLGRCGRLPAREGFRIAELPPAVTVDGRGRPQLLYFEMHNDERSRIVLRFATCEPEDRWSTTTVGPAASTYAALALDATGHPHIAYARPREGGGEELVYVTDAPAPPRPAASGEGCGPAEVAAAGGGCEPLDPRVAPALEACGRLEIDDEPGLRVEESADGFRCLVLDRGDELARQALALAGSRCEAGDALGCYLAGALQDYVTTYMLFDPVLCVPPPGGVCMDHAVLVVGARIERLSTDLARARERYGRACELGERRACLRVASMSLSRDRDDALAYRASRPSCEEGHLAACAMAFEATRASDQPGEEALRTRALALFEQRCAASSWSACVNLAYCLARGEGVARDDARARTLLDRACAAGYEPACRSLTALRGR